MVHWWVQVQCGRVYGPLSMVLRNTIELVLTLSQGSEISKNPTFNHQLFCQLFCDTTSSLKNSKNLELEVFLTPKLFKQTETTVSFDFWSWLQLNYINQIIWFFLLKKKQPDLEVINKIPRTTQHWCQPIHLWTQFFLCRFTKVCGNEKHHMKPSWAFINKDYSKFNISCTFRSKNFQITFIRSRSSRAFQQYQEHAQTSL